jgi:CBS domain-containing protein
MSLFSVLMAGPPLLGDLGSRRNRRAGHSKAQPLHAIAEKSPEEGAMGRLFERMSTRRQAVEAAKDATGDSTALWIGLGIIGAVVAVGLTRMARSGGRTVGEVMIEHPLTIAPTATLREAAELMREGNVGMLPVAAGGRLQGIITDRDVVVRAVARGADPSTVRVTECATGQAVAARPDWDIDQAMRVMADCQIGRLPVVDDGGRIVGVVSLSSLALRSAEDEEALETAQAVSRRSARRH